VRVTGPFPPPQAACGIALLQGSGPELFAHRRRHQSGLAADLQHGTSGTQARSGQGGRLRETLMLTPPPGIGGDAGVAAGDLGQLGICSSLERLIREGTLRAVRSAVQDAAGRCPAAISAGQATEDGPFSTTISPAPHGYPWLWRSRHRLNIPRVDPGWFRRPGGRRRHRVLTHRLIHHAGVPSAAPASAL